MNSLPGISIVVCCYNSASRLPETIQHLANQKVDKHIAWEVIIVNNNSTDQTKEVAQEVWNKQNSLVPFIILDEPNPGLSHARHLGFQTASYEYVLFCDDDNWLNETYVQTVYTVMSSNPSIGALGGKGQGVCESTPPSWYTRLGFYIFAINSQADKSGEVPRGMVYGAGATFRKSLYLFLVANGFKSMLSDRRGKELSSGGDDELCYMLRLIGYKVWYEESLLFKHFIPKERLNWEYFRRFFVGSAKTTNVLSPFADILEKQPYIQNKLRRYHSLYKVYIFLTKDAWEHYKKRTRILLGHKIQISEVEMLAFHVNKMKAKHWLKYWEYYSNLNKILALETRLKNALSSIKE